MNPKDKGNSIASLNDSGMCAAATTFRLRPEQALYHRYRPSFRSGPFRRISSSLWQRHLRKPRRVEPGDANLCVLRATVEV